MTKPLSAPPQAWEKLEWHKLLTQTEPSVRPAKKFPSAVAPAGLMPWIALIDMNSYFATLEQQANPYLRGKPVGILKEQGRSCVIAASKEAKQFGVKTGMGLHDARRLCPGFVTVAADFDRYFDNTRRLKAIFESLSPAAEVFSLDEAFLDLTSCRKLYATAAEFFAVAQQRVQAELGPWVTFSIGFGENRLQAKLGSELSAKDGFFEITAANLSACLAEAKVEDICGIGFALSAKLHQLGIEHPLQLNFYDDAFLREHFGVFWGPELRRIGRGENSHLLDLIDKPLPHMKSVGRSKTLFTPSRDIEYIRQLTYNLAEDMCFKARRMKLAGQQISLSLRDTDHGWQGGNIRVSNHVCHTDEVFGLLDQILRRVWQDAATQKPIIKVGVQLGQLQPLAELTESWLPSWHKQQRVAAAVDKVNEKYGLFTLKSARLLGFKILHPEVTGFLGDKTYQFEKYAPHP